MDPNALFASIITAAQEIVKLATAKDEADERASEADFTPEPGTEYDYIAAAGELAEAGEALAYDVVNLSNWLEKGGFPPELLAPSCPPTTKLPSTASKGSNQDELLKRIFESARAIVEDDEQEDMGLDPARPMVFARDVDSLAGWVREGGTITFLDGPPFDYEAVDNPWSRLIRAECKSEKHKSGYRCFDCIENENDREAVVMLTGKMSYQDDPWNRIPACNQHMMFTVTDEAFKIAGRCDGIDIPEQAAPEQAAPEQAALDQIRIIVECDQETVDTNKLVDDIQRYLEAAYCKAFTIRVEDEQGNECETRKNNEPWLS